MKVTRIEIKDFNQFKNLDIDLTYPKGHAKEGQPLDKVCFIGQSGTGKTTLLKLIGYGWFDLYSNDFFNYKFNEFSLTGTEKSFKEKLTYTKQLNGIGANTNYEKNDFKSKIYFDEKRKNSFKGFSKLINFPTNLKFEYNSKNNTLWNYNFSEKNIIDFEIDSVSEVWNEILEEVIKYRETILVLKNQISDMATSGDTGFYKNKLESAIQNYNDWIANNINPIHELANNCLDNLLTPFKLKIKREFEFTKKEDIGFIKIEDLNGNEVPFDLWSTGTRQLLYSTLPLYLLKPENTIILFDEPERSLYPDMQRMIIDFYSSLTKDSQFFYATHSPIIASSFEPWEIVELKLDENGHVYQELYYEGDKHIDNYKWNPKYMRWDDILQRIFDLDTDGSLERENKLNELATLNVKYKKVTKNGDINSKEATNLLIKISQLQKELSKWS